MKSSNSKYRHVQAQLEAAIRSGEFKIGEQLPTEQSLAERYGVSYLTARRAVCELVDADLLERRSRKQGTFVRPHGLAKVKTATLQLITSAYEGAFHRSFLEHGTRLAKERDWLTQIIRLSEGQQEPAVRAIRDGDLALVMLDDFDMGSALGLAMRSAPERAVLLGRDQSSFGVPSIRSEPRCSIELAISHLREWGHVRFALVMQGETDVSPHHLAAWESVLAEQFPRGGVHSTTIHVKTPMFHCPTRDAYLAMRKALAHDEQNFTAAVCYGEEITQGVLAACHDSGRPVPEGLSVVNVLDAPPMAFSHPPVTCVDVNLEEQIRIALHYLDSGLRGDPRKPQLWKVAPGLIERESVAAPLTAGRQLLLETRPPVSRQKLELMSAT